MSFMDTAQLLGNLGEFVGAIVIVATLIYLAMQVRQNTNALHAQSRQAILSAAQTETMAVTDHPEIILNQLKTDSLTPKDHTIQCFWLIAVMRVREFAWFQYQRKVIDEAQWNQESQVIQSILGTPLNRSWWESIGRIVFSEDFVDFVDGLIRNQPVSNDIIELIAGWTNREADSVA